MKHTSTSYAFLVITIVLFLKTNKMKLMTKRFPSCKMLIRKAFLLSLVDFALLTICFCVSRASNVFTRPSMANVVLERSFISCNICIAASYFLQATFEKNGMSIRSWLSTRGSMNYFVIVLRTLNITNADETFRLDRSITETGCDAHGFLEQSIKNVCVR